MAASCNTYGRVVLGCNNVRFMLAAAPSDGGPPLALEEYSDSLHKSTLGLIQKFSGETNGTIKEVAKLVAVVRCEGNKI